MPRMKRTNIKRLPPIELNVDDPEQKAVWEHYQKLTNSGDAAQWIRDALALSTPALDDITSPHPKITHHATGYITKATVYKPELDYEDID